MRKRFHRIRRAWCGRCGYRQHACQCGSSQRACEFRVCMRLARDDRGLDPLVRGLVEPLGRYAGGYVPSLVEQVAGLP